MTPPLVYPDADSFMASETADSIVTHVGVTATRYGLTEPQYDALVGVLGHIRQHVATGDSPVTMWLHHGDCTGGDHTVWHEARARGWNTCVHPPDVVHQYRAWTHNDHYMEPAPYARRNRMIVDHSRFLIGLPDQRERSGTLQTFQMAIDRLGSGLDRVWLIDSDGDVRTRLIDLDGNVHDA